MKKPGRWARLFGDERNYERPFFIFLTLAMAGIYIMALTSSTVLHTAWKIVLFTVLMNIHIAFYWLSPLAFQRQRLLVPLLLVQGLIAFSLGMTARVVGIIFGLYPGLVGLIIGAPIGRVRKSLIIVFYLILSALNYVLLTDIRFILWWAIGTIPVIAFTSTYVILYLRQADAREQAQTLLKELEAANQQLREYAHRVEELTVANERQRMARELHDTLSQGLAGLILQLEAADAHLAGNRVERGRNILRESMEKARGTLADARRAIDDLRQTAPRDLEAVIHQEVELFRGASGITCEPEIDLRGRVPGPMAEAAARVVSEGLLNIARHAQAKNVVLRLIGGQDELRIEISDDGIGFDPGSVEAGHYGLLGMNERVRLAGGELEIVSKKGKGTTLKICFHGEGAAHA